MSDDREPLPEVLAGGDRRASLEALRTEIGRRLPGAADREAVGLTTQLRLILAELEALDTGEEADVVDDLAKRRAARRAGAADPGGAAGAE
ncbi:hypothetical protein [Nocardiopsis sp. YSL2]|uniref:hypothetical protein n=1 Tax=Nocardiopsis sp. YSL2 TaxID=2939492 RepID=UPI0026F452BB|nr:hypothetical protein [Nocardiopsis sp. YSL2]